MKRILTFSLMISAASSLFAAARYSSDSFMEGFLGILAIIGIILGVTLFFKVWGMCNNVKRMKEIMESMYKGQKQQTKTEPHPKKKTDVNLTAINPW